MIFVTGGTGLIGSFVLQELHARGLAVRALYRGAAAPATAPAGIDWVRGDLLDSSLLDSALTADVTHVLHCAGLVSYAPQDEDALLHVNVEGTAAVVDACLRRPGIRLGYVSSVAALGQPAADPAGNSTTPRLLDETATWDLGASHPAYATSKYLAELEVWRGIAEGLAAVIVNPSIVLGPGDWHRSSTRLLRYAYDEHRFYTQGQLNFVDVRDVVAHLLRLTLDLPALPAARYILNGGLHPLGEFLTELAAAFGRRPPTVAVPNWAAEVIWRLEYGRALLTGGRPLITRDTARAGRQPVRYDAERAMLATGLPFRPLAETIAWLAEATKTNRTPHPTVVS
ncbi:NAD-dependent epimerase/dehydratase family protein [Hymenobacter cheonanensis]|uniref:NAD-dependent epimerase/dehydratase family protein n=1 Tax=Hymenobacter sp. CA2-7 TaxID=3063993 RepID=UPI0027140A95|nr:NAD-dependent epimerase/dehydratase family protein [Hymenobacter sp. CA2-7]MDO7885023.1 NAD-dependent epimerase/dehydratase family protein [Hymenobacter sp. CA2-7]